MSGEEIVAIIHEVTRGVVEIVVAVAAALGVYQGWRNSQRLERVAAAVVATPATTVAEIRRANGSLPSGQYHPPESPPAA